MLVPVVKTGSDLPYALTQVSQKEEEERKRAVIIDELGLCTQTI